MAEVYEGKLAALVYQNLADRGTGGMVLEAEILHGLRSAVHKGTLTRKRGTIVFWSLGISG